MFNEVSECSTNISVLKCVTSQMGLILFIFDIAWGGHRLKKKILWGGGLGYRIFLFLYGGVGVSKSSGMVYAGWG